GRLTLAPGSQAFRPVHASTQPSQSHADAAGNARAPAATAASSAAVATDPQVSRNQSNNARARHVQTQRAAPPGARRSPVRLPQLGTTNAILKNVVHTIEEVNTAGQIDYEHVVMILNPAAWRDEYIGGHASEFYFARNAAMNWTIHPGVSASAALRAWLAGPTIAECGTLVVASHLNALRLALGDANFDRLFGSSDPGQEPVSRLTISNNHWQCMPADFFTLHRFDASAPLLIPGAKYYFKNHFKYLYRHPDGALQGLNAVYIGEDPQHGPMWSGFGVPGLTKGEIFELFREAYDVSRTEEDYEAILCNVSTKIPEGVLQQMRAQGESHELIYRYFSRQPGCIHPCFLETETTMDSTAFFSGANTVALDPDCIALNVEKIEAFRLRLDRSSDVS
ncbi:MAG: hypothetical protein ACRYGK_15805, partial [Janthinobacterium lividum]